MVKSGKKIHVISERTAELPRTIFSRFIGMRDKNIISLGPGEPDFSTPANVNAAAKRAIDKGYTGYTRSEGLIELREAISRKIKRENNLRLDDPEKNIHVTTGSTEGILMSVLAAIDPTEDVLVPNPGFLAYTPTIELVDVQATSYMLNDESGFQIDVDKLKKLITPKTLGIIVNTPSNPTGTVLSRKVLEEIADMAIENDLTIISDEAYEAFAFGKSKHISIGSFNGLENHVISLYSVSKTYAMPGWRIGYVVAPEKVIESMNKMHTYTTLCAPSISQFAAIEALTGPQQIVKKMSNEYDRRRKFILKRIKEINGLEVKVEPEGAFYVFPRFDIGKKMTSEQFSLWLLDKAKVVTIPGTEFGSGGQGFIRLSYATNMKKIEIAMDRIEKLLGSS